MIFISYRLNNTDLIEIYLLKEDKWVKIDNGEFKNNKNELEYADVIEINDKGNMLAINMYDTVLQSKKIKVTFFHICRCGFTQNHFLSLAVPPVFSEILMITSNWNLIFYETAETADFLLVS